ncbi:hypothetical protein O0L34_g4817 [Tuta absoluta]|nr:hypothetical protein O0L34_g4817 [Tuta absoluta]
MTGYFYLPGYMAIGSPLPDEVMLRKPLGSQKTDSNLPSPVIRLSDRLVNDAIRRASLTKRPSIVKYPPDFFNMDQSTSSSEDESKVIPKKRGSKHMDDNP